MTGVQTVALPICFPRFDAAFTLSHQWFPEGKGLEAKTSLTNLFGNVAGSYNGLHARRVRNFFLRDLLVSGGDSDSVLRGFAVDYLQDEESRRKIVDFLNLADFGFKDIRLKQLQSLVKYIIQLLVVIQLGLHNSMLYMLI